MLRPVFCTLGPFEYCEELEALLAKCQGIEAGPDDCPDIDRNVMHQAWVDEMHARRFDDFVVQRAEC